MDLTVHSGTWSLKEFDAFIILEGSDTFISLTKKIIWASVLKSGFLMMGLVHRQQQPNFVETCILKTTEQNYPTNPVTL